MNQLLSILTGRTVNNYKDVVKEAWNDSEPPYVSGFVLEADEIYNVCPGKVVDVNSDDDGYSVSVLINSNQVVRYTHLKEVFVEENDSLFIKDMIGLTGKHSMFEYCTTTKGSSIWPVRIHDLTFYKHNPEEIISDKLRPQIAIDDSDWDTPISSEITEGIDNMLSNNRGE